MLHHNEQKQKWQFENNQLKKELTSLLRFASYYSVHYNLRQFEEIRKFEPTKDTKKSNELEETIVQLIEFEKQVQVLNEVGRSNFYFTVQENWAAKTQLSITENEKVLLNQKLQLLEQQYSYKEGDMNNLLAKVATVSQSEESLRQECSEFFFRFQVYIETIESREKYSPTTTFTVQRDKLSEFKLSLHFLHSDRLPLHMSLLDQSLPS